MKALSPMPKGTSGSGVVDALEEMCAAMDKLHYHNQKLGGRCP